MNEHAAPRSTDRERGFAAVWMVLTLFLLLGVAAVAVDLVNGLLQSQRAQNAADAASLSGVVYLPDVGTASTTALDIARQNGYVNGVDGAIVTATQPADPFTLKVEVKRTFKTFFARVMGFDTLTVRKSSTAEFEPPKTKVVPLDLVFIVDRTSSMTPADLNNAKDASRALLEALDPSFQHAALGVLGPSTTTSPCPGAPAAFGNASSSASTGAWIVSPFPGAAPASDYQNLDGTLNTASQIVRTIACFNTSSVRTNLGTPIDEARAYLAAHGRTDARQAIILMTDGEANAPNHTSCSFAFDNATVAKAADIEIVTIGFGIGGTSCTGEGNESPSPYTGQLVTKLLADMASPVDGVPATDNGCTEQENTDGDNFFCQPKSGDLSDVFVKAVTQLSVKREPHLVG